jgi:hypothetical protein
LINNKLLLSSNQNEIAVWHMAAEENNLQVLEKLRRWTKESAYNRGDK